MSVIDFHSHILPGIDDGSKSVSMSAAMLRLAAQQGVELMVATPHFYPERDRMEEWLRNRRAAYELLEARKPAGAPEIRLGAEVAFFKGISGASKIDSLTVEGTRLLLLEMPFAPWDESDVREVLNLAERRGFKVMLAHLERFMNISGNRRWIEEFGDMPLIVQINADSLQEWKKKGKLIRMFRDRQAHVLGSDCHGIHHRAPNLGQGRAVLRKKLGDSFLEEMDQTGDKLLGLCPQERLGSMEEG